MNEHEYVACKGLHDEPIPDCEGVKLKVGDHWVGLFYRKSDGEMSLSCDRKLVIIPVASNVVRLEVRS